MILLKNHLIIRSLIIILSVLALLSGCTEYQQQNDNSRGSITDNSVSVSSDSTENQSQKDRLNESEIDTSVFDFYCAKEETAENRIYFNYPLFKETADDAEELNEVIEEFVVSTLQKTHQGDFKGNLRDTPEDWKWDNSSYTLLAMKIDYKIMRNDSDYFSVTFEGLFNVKTAAHPLNEFYSLTIDKKTLRQVTLSDFYRIDIDFAELVRKEFQEQVRAGLAERAGTTIDKVDERVEKELSSLSDESLVKALRQANTVDSSGYGFYFYMTDTALGISVSVSHALGDHFEILIPFEELESFIVPY